MRNGFLACAVAAATLVTGSIAHAQVRPAFNWNGFYIGGNLGYGWGNSDPVVSNIPNFAPTAPLSFPTFSAANPSGGLNLDGVIGGGQIGWNFQSGNWVFGIETDLQAASQDDSRTADPIRFTQQTGGGNVIFGTLGGSLEQKLQWLGTVRGRVGQAWDNVLVYGTGGLAYGRVKISGTETISGTYIGGGIPIPGGCFGGCGYSGSASFGDSQTKLGWTLGAGIEAVLWASNWTWKVEYLYVDLGSIGGALPYTGSVTNPGGAVTPISTTVNYDSRFTDHIVRVGLNYRFGPR